MAKETKDQYEARLRQTPNSQLNSMERKDKELAVKKAKDAEAARRMEESDRRKAAEKSKAERVKKEAEAYRKTTEKPAEPPKPPAPKKLAEPPKPPAPKQGTQSGNYVTTSKNFRQRVSGFIGGFGGGGGIPKQMR